MEAHAYSSPPAEQDWSNEAKERMGLYPPHFHKGAQISLSTGEIKSVEELSTEDFEKCTQLSADLKLDSSTVAKIEHDQHRGMVILSFLVGHALLQITVEAPIEHPFFVYGKGWCSVHPESSMNKYNLRCQKLIVGDVCASLTKKSCKPCTQ
ncbi:ataxin-1-like [Styela clava]|uniref:ataxin-1-like n=1 Tax=Styela clava TaxID=7725 RepID=UPI00193A3A09|nr:ataxin-1-like [Styela clava]